jgi:hypothetical protein
MELNRFLFILAAVLIVLAGILLERTSRTVSAGHGNGGQWHESFEGGVRDSLGSHADGLWYPWQPSGDRLTETIRDRIAPPEGYQRLPVPPRSFENWLRHLPLKSENAPVLLYDGRRKGNQSAHVAVVDIDVGSRDLQQCADAAIRLRAEYLFSIHAFDDIHFKFTSGHTASYPRWIRGARPVVNGNEVRWTQTHSADSSYAAFRRYLDTVFMYAGSYSLSRELESVGIRNMTIGDVFIQGGFPGHAVIVVDMAVSSAGRDTLFLLAQSYMPAQEIHILNNHENPDRTPWYSTRFGEVLKTPEWTFTRRQLKRFETSSSYP